MDITAPNALHKEMALAAIAKANTSTVKKPLATSASDARLMTKAASDAGVCTQVGFNYLANPMFKLARQMIKNGELGEIRSYRGVHAEDYMADARSPITFRHDPAGGGALADLGSHALATAEYLMGPISTVLGDTTTLINQRMDSNGDMQEVVVDDVARAMLRFNNGSTGSIEANWIATGRKMQHDFEVYGSEGSLVFSQERLNELRYYAVSDAPHQSGFKTIVAGPEHDPYAHFCVAPGHQLGFNDLKAIEINGFVTAIANKAAAPFDFRQGWRIQHLVESIYASADKGKWVTV